MLRGSEMVEGLAVRVKPEPKVADSDDDDVVERRRFRARSLASSIFSRAVREAFECGLLLALSRCWETVLDAVMESSSLWNLRFDVAIASGMVVYFVWCIIGGTESLEAISED
jgi:hypothetical protein